MPLVVQNVRRIYGAACALDGFSLSVADGEILAILGPSGSGKSTLLRVIAGLETPDYGEVLFDGSSLAHTPAHRRGFGLMFQDYCLFPHLRVDQNIEFGLRMQHTDPPQRRERVREMLRLVRLEGFAGRDVLTLSGGEQQRVALARSLAPAPRLLMLDEPLGALDATLRVTLLSELGDILREVGITVLYVTHDQAEAMTIASRIALIDSGRLMQAGSPDELIRSPADARVASFLGLGALLPGHMSCEGDLRQLSTSLGTITLPAGSSGCAGADSSGACTLLVRGAAISAAPSEGHLPAEARLISRRVRPQDSTLRIGIRDSKGAEYPLEITLASGLESGARSWEPGKVRPIWIDPSYCQVVQGMVRP
jgi:ABC-type Fe3+/spermidine/putrescine transport system ATPase subunit